MRKPRRLILETVPDENIILFDMVSRTTTKLKVFYMGNGKLALAFESPGSIIISRERQRIYGR